MDKISSRAIYPVMSNSQIQKHVSSIVHAFGFSKVIWKYCDDEWVLVFKDQKYLKPKATIETYFFINVTEILLLKRLNP